MNCAARREPCPVRRLSAVGQVLPEKWGSVTTFPKDFFAKNTENRYLAQKITQYAQCKYA